MCTQTQLHAILHAIYQRSVEEFGDKLDAVILYGSYARGDYNEDSDIDVMVRVRMDAPELNSHRWEMSGFSSELDLKYNAVTSINLQPYEIFERGHRVFAGEDFPVRSGFPVPPRPPRQGSVAKAPAASTKVSVGKAVIAPRLHLFLWSVPYPHHPPPFPHF